MHPVLELRVTLTGQGYLTLNAKGVSPAPKMVKIEV
jgi:hypothetical protein